MAVSPLTTLPGRPVTLADVFARRIARGEPDGGAIRATIHQHLRGDADDVRALNDDAGRGMTTMTTTIGAIMSRENADGVRASTSGGKGGKVSKKTASRRAPGAGGIASTSPSEPRKKTTTTPSKTRMTRSGAVSTRTRLAFNAICAIDGKKSAQKATVRVASAVKAKKNSGKNSDGKTRGGVADAREAGKPAVGKTATQSKPQRTMTAGQLAYKEALEKRVNARMAHVAQRDARQNRVNSKLMASKTKKKLLAPSGDLTSVENTPVRNSTKQVAMRMGMARGRAELTGRGNAEPGVERVSLSRESRRHATAFEDNPRYKPDTIRVKLPSLLSDPAPGEWLSQERLLEVCQAGSFIDVRVSSLTSATLHVVKNSIRKDPRTMKNRWDTPYIRVQVLEHFADATGWVVTTVRVLPESFRRYRLALTPLSGRGLVHLVFNLCEEAAYGCLRLFKLEPNISVRKNKRTRDAGNASPSTLDSEAVVHQPGTPPRARAAPQSRKKQKSDGSSDLGTRSPSNNARKHLSIYALPSSAHKDNPTPSSTNGGMANEDGSPTESPSRTTSSHGVTVHNTNEERSLSGVFKISDNLVPSQVRTITGDGVELPPMSYAQQQTISTTLQNQQHRRQIQQQQQPDFLRQEQEDDYNMVSTVPQLPLLYESVNDVYSRLVSVSGVSPEATATRPADRGRAEGMFLNDMYSPRASTIFPSSHHEHQYHHQQQHHQHQQQQLTEQQQQQMPPPVSIPVQRVSNPAVYYLPVPIPPHSAPGTVTHAVLGGMRVRVIVESIDQPQSAPSRDIAAPPHDYRQVREPESAARARARQSNPNAGRHTNDRRYDDDDDDIVAANLLMLKTSIPKKKSSKSKSSKPSTSKHAKKMANLSTF